MSLLFKRKQLFDKQTRSKVKIFFLCLAYIKNISFLYDYPIIELTWFIVRNLWECFTNHHTFNEGEIFYLLL